MSDIQNLYECVIKLYDFQKVYLGHDDKQMKQLKLQIEKHMKQNKKMKNI